MSPLNVNQRVVWLASVDVSPEDLILSKLDWAKESRSQMQLDDVRNLLRSVQGLDTEYLNRWADRLGLTTLYQEVCQ